MEYTLDHIVGYNMEMEKIKNKVSKEYITEYVMVWCVSPDSKILFDTAYKDLALDVQKFYLEKVDDFDIYKSYIPDFAIIKLSAGDVMTIKNFEILNKNFSFEHEHIWVLAGCLPTNLDRMPYIKGYIPRSKLRGISDISLSKFEKP